MILDNQKNEADDEKSIETETENKINQMFQEKRPKLIALCKQEGEGKASIKSVISIIIKNWKFRAQDAKILSQCIEKYDKLQSVEFIRVKLDQEAIDALILPNSGKLATYYHIILLILL